MRAQPQLALLPFAPASLARPRRVVLTDPEDAAQAEMRLQIIGLLLDYRSDAPRYRALRLKDGAPVTSFTRHSSASVCSPTRLFTGSKVSSTWPPPSRRPSTIPRWPTGQ